ncbi:MAG: multidrug ABC transporter permease/ATP-binding protein [[Pasteurella] aerogenes]|nr:multidrug ABC transporter permease/ATP-binding protein [[Pasteurella] aerogenes]
MTLLYPILKNYRWHLLGILLLTLIFSLMGIGVLAFINNQLLQTTEYTAYLLWIFIALLAIFLISSIAAQISLTALGHKLVYLLRKQLIKQILDSQTEHLHRLGKAKLLASLSNDIHNIAMAFVRLPELLQGTLLVICAGGYLYYLSEKLFFITALWLFVTVWVGNLAVKKVYAYLKVIREAQDSLYQDYQSAIEGHRELSLNRQRAQFYYEQELEKNAQAQYQGSIRADSYHVFAGNWTNVMVLGAVGMVFYLALSKNWTDLQTATTIAVTILFLRTPLITAIGAFPMLLTAKVALDKLAHLSLVPYQDGFAIEQPLPKDWKQIRFENVTYQYRETNQSAVNFSLKPINLCLNRGELTFLIGKNGSGKSTFSMLLAGLFRPTTGHIWVDDIEITANNQRAYQAQISAVFSDFYLFTQLLNNAGFADIKDVCQWLNQLQLEKKVQVENYRLSTTNLSQGQRKRLALLINLLEQRPLLILDEWAADQDPTFRRTFYQVLLPLLKQQGHTIFAISHDDHYFSLADRLLLIQQGELRELCGEEREMASRDAVEKLKSV